MVVLLGRCSVQEQWTGKKVNRNLSYLYIPGRTPLQPQYRVFHATDSISLLRMRIVPTQLLFNQADEKGNYLSYLDIRYRLFQINRRNTMLADSGKVLYSIDLDKAKNKSIEKSIMMRCSTGEKYVLEVIAIDQVRKTAVQNFLYVDKTSPFSMQNYFVIDTKTNKQIFSYALDSTRTVKILYRDQKPHDLFVRYFRQDTMMPPPPNLQVSVRGVSSSPDSTWRINRLDSLPIRLPRRGIYQFSIDSSEKEGVSLFNFGPFFPRIMSPDQLAEPMAYLLNETEMKNLLNQPARKLAVDKFWLGTTDNVEKARELVRIYYNRVYYANIFFTSYKEGWRTDRGMIYIIYGPPDNLTKSVSREVWTYGNKKEQNKISFTFRRIDTPFSLNVYRLGRGETIETRWVEAIRTWRQGNVFTVRNKGIR